MKKLLFIIIFPILVFSQPQNDTVKSDSMVNIAVKKLEEFDKKKSELEIKKQKLENLNKAQEKADKERSKLYYRFIHYLKNFVSKKEIEVDDKIFYTERNSDILKPSEYDTIPDEKEHIEQKPKTFFGRILNNLFGSKKKQESKNYPH